MGCARRQDCRVSADDFDWGSLAVWFLNELQVAMIEAMRCIDQPLSARDLSRVFYGAGTTRTMQHHLKRLVLIEAAVVTEIRRDHGVTEKLFRLTRADERTR